VTSTIHSVIALVAAHPAWAYAAVFVAALLEAVPVAGSFIPGSTIILGLGATIATGGLQLPAMLASAFAGALIGDGAAFWAGHRAKRQILGSWPLSAYPHVVARSEEFFERHGTLAVFFARFVAPVRAFIPLTAGALGMPPRRFFPVNCIAIGLWAPLHILPGLMAASALQHWGATEVRHPVTLAAIAVAGGVIAWAIWQHLRRPDPLPVSASDRGNGR
jgi:membrane protein DedA with SNARE-associated domain